MKIFSTKSKYNKMLLIFIFTIFFLNIKFVSSNVYCSEKEINELSLDFNLYGRNLEFTPKEGPIYEGELEDNPGLWGNVLINSEKTINDFKLKIYAEYIPVPENKLKEQGETIYIKNSNNNSKKILVFSEIINITAGKELELKINFNIPEKSGIVNLFADTEDKSINIFLTRNIIKVWSAPLKVAFPGAKGFGAYTTHARGGKIIFVTNLNDSGPGSLRHALEVEEGPRYIIFKVNGVIRLYRPINIRNPYVYIAGQTAPGDGITLKGNGLRIGTHDVVVRFISSRPGDMMPEYYNYGVHKAFSVFGNGYNIIFDHVSASWAINKNMQLWNLNYNIRNITIQRSIISEGLYNSELHDVHSRSMGLLVGDTVRNVSIIQNLFAHHNQRNPLVKGNVQYVDILNNVIYNWGGIGTQISNWNPDWAPYEVSSHTNYVGNYYKKGPDSGNREFLYHNNKNTGQKLCPESLFFIQNNKGPNMFADVDNNWQYPERQSDEPVFTLFDINTTWSADETYEKILNYVGAILPIRDKIDSRIIKEVKQGEGGLISSVRETSGYPGSILNNKLSVTID